MVWFVRRDIEGKIDEAVTIPHPLEDIDEFEQLHGDNPEVQRFFDREYSYKDWVRKRIESDPFWLIVIRRLAQIGRITPVQERQAWLALAENILPDPEPEEIQIIEK